MAARLVEILCDGGPHGLGHLRRASALGWAFRDRGLNARVSAVSDEGRTLLPESPQDGGEAAARVLDLPYGVEDRLAGRRVPCVALDYFGAARPDLTISVLERSSPPPPGDRLSGLDYAIVRREILARRPAPGGRGVLVVIGGGDALGRGRATAGALAAAEETTLVEGPRAAGRGPVPAEVRLLRSPADLPALMAGCRWAVANGGVTMTELMCLGKPVWVVPQTPDEERLAHHILGRGGLLGVGEDGIAAPAPDRAREVGETAARLVDGRGAERVCASVEALLR